MRTWLLAVVACPLICAALLITAALNAPDRPVFITDQISSEHRSTPQR